MRNKRTAFQVAVWVLLLAPAWICGQVLSSEESVRRTGASEILDSRNSDLPPGAAEAARVMGIAPLVEQMRRPAEADRRDASMNLQWLALRQEITEAVLATSLQVDGVVAEIDSEIAQTNGIRAYLESRRDRRIGINTVANIVTGGGMGVVGQLIQIKNNTLGNVVGAVAGGASSILSVIAIRQQRGGQQSMGIAPNMLAKIFDRTPEFHSDYPEVVWSYLNAVPPTEGGTETRRAKLIKQWTQLGRLDAAPTPKAQHKIDLLTTSISQQTSLSIDVLADRAMMLADVRARLLLMKRDLGRLMQYLRALPAVSLRE